MNIPNDINQRRRYITIGIFMALISLVFLFYLGQSLVGLTRKYQATTCDTPSSIVLRE